MTFTRKKDLTTITPTRLRIELFRILDGTSEYRLDAGPLVVKYAGRDAMVISKAEYERLEAGRDAT